MLHRPLHILVLTDRDWTHPQGGGTGTNLYAQISRWLDGGHRVTVISGSYRGAETIARPRERLTIHRMGGRVSLFARAPCATARGLGRDADVILEVVNGIAFLTPLWFWLSAPRVTLIHHVHQDHYIAELGRRGQIAAQLAEHLPLRLLYGHHRFLTISNSARTEMVDRLGLPADRIEVSYLGVQSGDFPVAAKTSHPSLLYLGRLKQYKRLELLLDVLAALPDNVTLDIAGEGDDRLRIEAEVQRRRLTQRVTFHGHVDEQRKAELYAASWVNLTASSAEGWCLTVMEAACARTPSAALAVGGLPESIVDGQTGLLADDTDGLTARVRELIDDAELRNRLGDAAQKRARSFDWDRTAAETMAVLTAAAAEPRPRLRDRLRSSPTIAAAGLAVATLLNNAIQLAFVIVFSRLLGADGYGALASIVSAFLILMVSGQAIQVAAAREATLGRLGDAIRLSATLRRWTTQLLALTACAVVFGILLRSPLAQLLGVPEYEYSWAVAGLPATGTLWLLLCLQRGILQGLSDYGAVGLSIVTEGLGRLLTALAFFWLGLGVTGAYLGNPAAFALLIGWLALRIRRNLRSGRIAVDAGTIVAGQSDRPAALLPLLTRNWIPITGLLMLALLQNVDVIIGRHRFDGDTAGAYAVAAVAAKSVVWVAVGIGLQLLPEATRRAAAGRDPRPALLRALIVLAVIALPALAIFTLMPEFLLRVAFGPELTAAAGALPLLGLAMTLLAVGYLTVQYMVALGELRFVWLLALVAVVEPLLLLASKVSLVGYASVVLCLQLLAAVGLLAIGLRTVSHHDRSLPDPAAS